MTWSPQADAPPDRPFDFARDTFAFRNELVWEYQFDPVSGQRAIRWSRPPPTYAHRCFVLVRCARQFFNHAGFAPGEPAAPDEACADMVRRIVTRNPRLRSPASERVRIPGYDCLRSLSLERERLLKRVCGGAWQSYVLRSHWRMVFPISRRHQARTAAALADGVEAGRVPVVHLVRFPSLTINHGIVLYGMQRQDHGLRFEGYDPNIPEHPAELSFDAATSTFQFPANRYFAGGRVDVIEIYRNWLY